jgi:DnaK suppressor protein
MKPSIESEQASLRQAMITRLTELYRTVRADMDANLVAGLFDHEPEDVGDQGVHDQDLDFRDQLDERAAALAQQIEDALYRMRDGSYGRCAEDDQPIPLERLRAIPWAERCAAHQTKLEAGQPRHSTL